MATFSGSEAVRKTILLLSGTSEGPLLARALSAAGFRVRATVTRAEACTTLFGAAPGIEVEARGFTEESLTEFLLRKEADLVLDATHPFAVRITRLAHAVCGRLATPYVRYERPDWAPPMGTILVDSYAEAAARLPELGRRILLTIGAKQLKHFTPLQAQLELYARILPFPESLRQSLEAGAERVMCLRPPFSRAFNRAILQEYRIEGLLTKASGQEGGVVEKVEAAADLGVRVMMIRRPALAEIAHVSSISAAVAACRRWAES
jgi:precorrin-6A/cobalt-precorrin-6A reductase